MSTYTIALRNTAQHVLDAVAIASDTLSRIGGGDNSTSGPVFVSNSAALLRVP
ncbi:MAG: hypothetical protein R3D67_15120 [Hyphomicrobiaceae bacterium]